WGGGGARLPGRGGRAVRQGPAPAPWAGALATPCRPMTAPAAPGGGRVPAATSASSRRSGGPGAPAPRAAEKVPRWAPASGPWTPRPSAPREAASAGSSGVVTVTHTRLPAACSAALTAGHGQAAVDVAHHRGAAPRA